MHACLTFEFKTLKQMETEQLQLFHLLFSSLSSYRANYQENKKITTANSKSQIAKQYSTEGNNNCL